MIRRAGPINCGTIVKLSVSDQDNYIRQVFSQGSILFVGLVFQLGISFFAKLIVARELTLSDFGGVALGMTTASVVGTVALLGLQEGIGRYLPRYDTDADRRGVLVSGFSISAPTGLLAGGLLFVLVPMLTDTVFNSPEIAPTIRVFSLIVPLVVVHRLIISTTQGNQQAAPKVILENLLRPTSRFLAIGAVIIVGVSSVRIAWAYVVGWTIPAAVGLVYLYRETNLFDFGSPTDTKRREMLHFSIPLLLSSTLAMMFSDLDTLLLGYFTAATDSVGIYDAIYSLGELLMTGIIAFGFVFMPIISEFHADDKMDQARRIYQVVTKWVVIATFPVFLVLVTFPERVISLTFGAKYAGGAAALSILATGFFIHAIFGLNRETIVSIGKPRIKMAVDFGGAAVNLLLNLVLIPTYGPLGAATATTITFFAMNVVLSTYLYRHSRIVPFAAATLRPVAVSGLVFILAHSIISNYFMSTIPVLFVGFATFCLVYAVAIFRFGGIQEEEVLIINSVEEYFGVDLDLAKRLARRLM